MIVFSPELWLRNVPTPSTKKGRANFMKPESQTQGKTLLAVLFEYESWTRMRTLFVMSSPAEMTPVICSKCKRKSPFHALSCIMIASFKQRYMRPVKALST